MNQTSAVTVDPAEQIQPVVIPFERAEIESTIQARFARVVAACPSNLAIVGSVSYSYSELNLAANRLAHTLSTMLGPASQGAEEPVVLLLNHDTDIVVAMLGVLKAGQFYVSLPVDTPRARLRSLLENLGARLIITNTQSAPVAAELRQPGHQILNLDQLPNHAPTVDLPCDTLATAPATIAYTSGSTGTPKGIVKNHQAILHRIWNKTVYNNLNTSDRLALIHTSNFIEVWNALLNGATLIFYDIHQQGGLNLAQWLLDQQITSLYLPIELYRQLLDSLPDDAYFPHLRTVEPSGRFYRHDVEHSWQFLPPTAVIGSRYACSEAGRVTQINLSRSTPLTTNIIPTGYPIPDVEIFLLDPAGQLVATGEEGQIYVRSPYLPSGYWRSPELTSQVYQADLDRPGWRICCTGDWGRLRPDGMLEFIGRKDARVKIRGYRIDLGEVEAALYQLPEIRSVAVVAQEHPQHEAYLAAYYVPTAAAQPTTSELRAALAQSLPAQMIPAVFIRMEQLPQTPNGKIDRRALPTPDPGLLRARPPLDTPYLAPRTPIEATLTNIWSEVLDVEPVGVHDQFADLGGNSLRAMQIHARVVKQWQMTIPSRRLFECATVAEMALALILYRAEQTQSAVIEQLVTQLETLSEQDAAQLLLVPNPY